MYILVAAMLVTCNPPTLTDGKAEGKERRVYQASDLPTVRARDAVFDRAGMLPGLQDRDDLDRDLLYFHASRDSVDQLVSRYGWLGRAMAKSLKREVLAKQRKNPASPANRSTAPGAECDVEAAN